MLIKPKEAIRMKPKAKPAIVCNGVCTPNTIRAIDTNPAAIKEKANTQVELIPKRKETINGN